MFLFNNPQRTCCWCVWGPSVLIYTPCTYIWLFPQLFCCLGAPAEAWSGQGEGASGGMEVLCLKSSSRQWLFFLNNICRTMLCAQNHHYLLVPSVVFHYSSASHWKNQNLLCCCSQKTVGVYRFISRLSQQHSSSGSQMSAWNRRVGLPKEEKMVKDVF